MEEKGFCVVDDVDNLLMLLSKVAAYELLRGH